MTKNESLAVLLVKRVSDFVGMSVDSLGEFNDFVGKNVSQHETDEEKMDALIKSCRTKEETMMATCLMFSKYISEIDSNEEDDSEFVADAVTSSDIDRDKFAELGQRVSRACTVVTNKKELIDAFIKVSKDKRESFICGVMYSSAPR